MHGTIGCPMAMKRGVRRMPTCRNRSIVLCGLPLVILSSACCAKPDCDSNDTRNAVIQFILEDKNNPLLEFAEKNSTAKDSKPLYQLGQRMVEAEKPKDKSTLKCSGALSVSVGDMKATKEVNFTVQQSADGKLSVSVEPFQF